MSRLWMGVTVALVVAGGAGLFWMEQANARLRAENDSLRRESGQAAELREENRRLATASVEAGDRRSQQAELQHLRDEVAALKNQAASLPPSAPAGAPPPAGGKEAAKGARWAMADMTNEGRGTPQAAGQTVAWAVHHGDIELAASLLTFSPESRAKMEALVAALPDNLRTDFGTPEKLMAFVMAGTPRPVSSLQVLDEAAPGPDDFTQRVELQYEDGRVRTDTIRFHRAADGWQQVVSPTVVDRVANYLKSGSLPPAPAKK